MYEKLCPIANVPLRSMGMLFGPLRSRSLKPFDSGRAGKIISGWITFVVSFVRAVGIIKKKLL